MKTFKKLLLLFAIILSLSGQTVFAEEITRVYDSGAYTMEQALAQNGMTLTFLQKDAESWVMGFRTVPYIYSVNFDNNILVAFYVNDAGYINDIIISPNNASTSNYRKVAMQICKALGMDEEESNFLFEYRKGDNGGFPYVPKNNRNIYMLEQYTNEIVNNIFARTS